MIVADSKGNLYKSLTSFCDKHRVSRTHLREKLLKGGWVSIHSGLKVRISESVSEGAEPDRDELYEEFQSARNTPFNLYKIEEAPDLDGNGSRYAIALFSDAHVEESVNADTVLGLNEYNTDIAKERIERYFANLAICLKKDAVNTLYFASLGDTISGFIHEHLQQENGMTPSEAILFAQSLIVSGLAFLRDQLPDLEIIFIGVSGNHSRLTKKVQHSNGFKMSYEWIMYQNISTLSNHLRLNIRFLIPESELALVETPDGKRYLFCHGYQVQSKGTGTVAGIYPALGRLAMKWQKIFNQDKIFLGHYHTCVSIPTATVNGSVIGYNAFAMSNGMGFEEPAQQYEVYDSEIGLLLSRKIYCK